MLKQVQNDEDQRKGVSAMLMTTTSTVEGRPVREYLGVVTGEVIVGANIFKDLFASVRDIVGGRSGAYENSLRDARETALKELADEARALGADGVIGIDLDYEVLGSQGSMLMVSASGTAVRLG
jgi:uncharacterized protein YbjQ (UPF0145 family)